MKVLIQFITSTCLETSFVVQTGKTPKQNSPEHLKCLKDYQKDDNRILAKLCKELRNLAVLRNVGNFRQRIARDDPKNLLLL